MKTDLYTKVILTLIAVVLTLNLLKVSITPAMADGKHYATVPVNADGSINVRLAKTDGTLDVRIKEVDRTAFFYSNAIPVKIEK